jgi:hypothetical protein
VKASAITNSPKVINTPSRIETRIYDSGVHVIQDHLAQVVWIVEKTKERKRQEEIRDGAGGGEN